MTIEINLLPWREVRRQRRNRCFRFSMLLAAMVGLGAGYAVFWSYGQQLSAQRERLDYIEQQSAALGSTLARVDQYEARIVSQLQRLAALQALESQRSVTVEVFNALAASLQDDVYYASLERQGLSLTLSAVALSDSGVSNQLRALGSAAVFAEPHFSALQVSPEGQRFTLSVSQRMPVSQHRAEAGEALEKEKAP
ncbi:MAG: PilN domain-containing protein [Halomonas sp.]|uniref:PilN domain-containing protein n=1 Tax=Halomonas sp. TaxID=1486246 RepID=UPI003F91BEB3